MLAHVLAFGSPLDPLYYTIGWLLALFYKPVNVLGISIIVLTLVVMLAQFPLIAKQTRSMIQMQKIQPELKKIQQKYKDDRAKQTEELQKFYSENNVNPLAGCLPLLVIFPIGIAVFRTFSQGVQRHIPQTGPLSALYHDICSKGTVAAGRAAAQAKGVTVKTDLAACSYRLDHYPKGQTPPTFRFLGLNLNWSAHEAQTQLAGHMIQWAPYFLLIAIVIFTGWYQVRQTQARQAKQGGTPPNAQMQAITKVMPVFFGVITYGLNSATTIYFVVSNGWRIGQQHFVLNKFYEEEAASKKKPKPRSTDIEVEAADEGEATNGKAPPGKPASPRPGSPRSGGQKSGGSKPAAGQPPKSSTGASGSGGGASSGNGSGNRSGANAGAARRKKKRKR